MPVEIGQVLLNKYRVTCMLGRGGFGSVYEAMDLRLNVRVAIKELRIEFARDPDMLERFINEARAIAALNNPHILGVLTYDQDGDHHYMILEFMNGGSLADLLKKRGKLNPEEAIFIAQSVCEGLAAAHDLGIIHRDIKPANILMSKDGQEVKVSDFGIAHVPEMVAGRADLTQSGMTFGTVGYMSPEQARGAKVDTRSDLYAVGVMLYEMLAGYKYLDFTGNFLSDIEKLRTSPPKPLPADLPGPMKRTITKALAKDPAQRFQNAAEFSASLKACVETDASAGTHIFIPDTDAGKVIATTRSFPVMPLLAGGAVLVIVVLLVGLIASLSAKSPTPAPIPTQVVAILPTGTPVQASTPTPIVLPTANQTATFAAALAQAEATERSKGDIMTRVAATLTAAVPTITLTPTSSSTPTLTPIPTRTPTSTPTLTPAATPTHQVFPIRLAGPADRAIYKEEAIAPFLEWQPATDGPLGENEWYRIQVYHQMGTFQCNIYTKRTSFQLPPSGVGPCNPATWRYNTGDYNWRISLVIKLDDDVNHDQELINSEGRSFRWNK